MGMIEDADRFHASLREAVTDGRRQERARIVAWLASHGPEYAMTLARLATVIAAQPESQ